MATAQARLIDKATAHAVDLLRVSANLRGQVLAVLRRLESSIIAEIAQVDPTGPARETYRQKRLTKILEQTRATIASGYNEAADLQRGFLDDLAPVEQAAQVRMLNTAIKVDVASVALTPVQLREIARGTLILGAPSGEWWARQRASVVQRFTDEMRLGLLRGEGVGDLIRRVRGRAVGRGQYVGGIMDVTTRQAEALARTSVQAVAQSVREQVGRANEDLMNGWTHLSTLDARTSQVCMARSGLRWTFDGEPVGHSLPYSPPPVHWNCRSQLVYWLKSWEELSSGRIKAKFTPATQASMDGQIPADLDYQGWLKTKPEAFQREVLGPGRYKLFQEGKLTLRQMIDQNDNPLTLKELAKKVGA